MKIADTFTPPFTAEEEAEIERRALSDPDNPPLTAEDFAKAKPFKEVFPEMYAKLQARKKAGRPKIETPKQAISIRLDQDVLEKFRNTGPGWQTRINEALRRAEV